MVLSGLHGQTEDLSPNFQALSMNAMGLPSDLCVHAGPLIHRGKEYALQTREQRRGIFDRMIAFIHKANISYRCFCIDKHFLGEGRDVRDPLLQQIGQFLIANATEFNSFDKLKVYYRAINFSRNRLLFSASMAFVKDSFRNNESSATPEN